jgi:O-antigen/teichoic acid export membrane protein
MSKLSRNIIFNLTGQSCLMALGFVAVRYILRGLGADALGIIYFALTASSVISAMLDLGIGSSAIREISRCVTSEPEYVTEFVRTGSSFFWSTYIVLALALFLGAPAIVGHWLKLKTLDSETAIRVLRVIGIASLVALPRTLYVGVLRGLQRMEFNNLIDVAASGLQQFGTIAILLLGGGLLRVVHWFAICYFASIAAYVVTCSRLLSPGAMVPGFFRAVVKKNFNFASNMAATSVLSVIESQADKVIVSKLLPIGMFGYYGVAYAAVSKGMLITGSIADAALPSFCELHGMGSTKTLLSQYSKLQDLLCFITMPIFAAVPFAALPVFGFVLNAEAARLLMLPTTFLCLGFYLNSTLHAAHLFSLAAGRPDISARFNLYALFVVPTAAILLIHFLGLIGAGLSWVVYNLFSYGYAIPRICAECGLGITPLKWYAHVSRFLGPGAVIYGLAWFFCRTIGHSSIAALILGYVLASLVFVCGSFLFIGTDLRSTFQGLARSFRAKYAEVF